MMRCGSKSDIISKPHYESIPQTDTNFPQKPLSIMIEDGDDFPNGSVIKAEKLKVLTDENLWSILPQSTYGLVVHSCLTDSEEEFVSDMKILLVPMLMTAVGQAYILYELWFNILSGANYLCTCRAPLAIIILFVFLNNAKSSLDDVLTEFCAITTCTRYVISSEMKLYKCSMNFARRFLGLMTISFEFLVLAGTIIVGTYNIISQESAKNICLASVSILFINGIDNLVYQNMLPKSFQNGIGDFLFELPTCPTTDKTSAQKKLRERNSKHYSTLIFQVYYQAAFYLLLASIVVYGMRYYNCPMDSGLAFWDGTDDTVPTPTYAPVGEVPTYPVV